MKKCTIVFVLGALLLTGCGVDMTTVLSNPEKDYYATGNWQGWSAAEATKMTAVARGDDAVATIKDQLKEAEFLYVYEGIVLSAEPAGWGSTYTKDGVDFTIDGNLTVKIIRTALGDKDSVDYWIQSPESGAVSNLTPDTLFMPEFVPEASAGTLGHSNSNPGAYEAGTYTLVYAALPTGHAMGLIKTA